MSKRLTNTGKKAKATKNRISDSQFSLTREVLGTESETTRSPFSVLLQKGHVRVMRVGWGRCIKMASTIHYFSVVPQELPYGGPGRKNEVSMHTSTDPRHVW